MSQRTTKFPPRTLVNLEPVKVFAATYVDGEQVHDTRLVVVHGGHVHFLHPLPKDDASLRPPAGWLRDAILSKVDGPPTQIDSEDLPKDNVEIPMEGGV
ncbi:MAG: hypothetical protein KAY24_19930 [Candidatus Eisenbacteria sp.]|nr:hypothetical protein [Candidatus Eisenbacteria bacterium]